MPRHIKQPARGEGGLAEQLAHDWSNLSAPMLQPDDVRLGEAVPQHSRQPKHDAVVGFALPEEGEH